MEVPHRDLGDGDIGEAGANRPSLVFALVLSHVLVSAAQARGTLAVQATVWRGMRGVSAARGERLGAALTGVARGGKEGHRLVMARGLGFRV